MVGPPSEAAVEAVDGREAEVTTAVEAVAEVISTAEGGVAAITTKLHLLYCTMCHLFDFFLQCTFHILAIINCVCPGLVLCHPVPISTLK